MPAHILQIKFPLILLQAKAVSALVCLLKQLVVQFVSINSPSGEGGEGGREDSFKRNHRWGVSINSPSGEGGEESPKKHCSFYSNY